MLISYVRLDHTLYSINYGMYYITKMIITQSNVIFKTFNIYIHDLGQNIYLTSPHTSTEMFRYI